MTLQFREYGKTGIKVSVLGFGTARFPLAKRDFDMDFVVGLLKHAIHLGINYVDTSEIYSFGRSEIAIGEAIQGQRERVYVATKYAFVHKHQSGTAAHSERTARGQAAARSLLHRMWLLHALPKRRGHPGKPERAEL